MPDLPMWAWLVLAHVAGLGGGFVLATVFGVAKAVQRDTDWHLAELQQSSDSEEVPK